MINSTSFTDTSQLTAAVPMASQSDQIVRVRAGQLELTMRTDLLSGVYQVSKQNRLTGRNTVLTPKGEFPVYDLQNVIRQKLDVDVNFGESNATTLIAIKSDGSTKMILAESVSRPTAIRPEHVHPMPKLCFGKNDGGLIASVMNIEPTSTDPQQCIRFLFDPRGVVEDEVECELTERPNPMPKEAASAIAVAVAARFGGQQTSRSGQLLAFIPEDIRAEEVEHVFCLPLNAIAEVVMQPPRLDTTGANEFFEGFALWRTVPIPIVRLGNIFGFSSIGHQHEGRRLLVARTTGNRFVGFYTKSQMDTMKVPQSVAGDETRFSGRPHLGCFRTEFGELVVPDLNRILAGDF